MRTFLQKLVLLAVLTAPAVSVDAQQPGKTSRQMVAPSIDFFVPHWQVDVQAGGGYDVGEDAFFRLVSPALQLSGTYQFLPALGVRVGASGLWARNRYAFPEARYKWNFVQPAVDLKADLTTLFAGWDPERRFSAYAFVGGGVAYSYGNDDAVEANKLFGIEFKKLWYDHRWNPVVRGGLGAELRLNDFLAVTAEANANMLPDHFNSKHGRHDNSDWHMNALLGLKFYLGESHGRTEPIYREVQVPSAPVEQPRVVAFDLDSVMMTVLVQFDLNQSVLRDSEYPKLVEMARYMQAHPTSTVVLTGYADRETGTADINERLSQERAQVVSAFLVGRGIGRDRIVKYAKGDRVQPFQVPEANRVTICLVTDHVTVQQNVNQ